MNKKRKKNAVMCTTFFCMIWWPIQFQCQRRRCRGRAQFTYGLRICMFWSQWELFVCYCKWKRDVHMWKTLEKLICSNKFYFRIPFFSILSTRTVHTIANPSRSCCGHSIRTIHVHIIYLIYLCLSFAYYAITGQFYNGDLMKLLRWRFKRTKE